MTPHVSPAEILPSHDPDFDLLVDGLIARIQAGEALDWSAVAGEHPRYASRLRSLAVALEALGDLSGGGESALSGVASGSGEQDRVAGVLGDFKILRELGRGGMGVVYEAEQVSLNRRVALKVLPLAATMDPRQLERFRHEARAAGLLHHPHIVPVYGVGCERGVHYYAMQLIEGCSLAAVIAQRTGSKSEVRSQKSEVRSQKSEVRSQKSEGRQKTAGPSSPTSALILHPSSFIPHPFRWRRVAELVAQVADALEYAHTMGVVHRDVKPANLLLDAAGNVWITDFGLARLGESTGLTVSGDLLGTLRYMSPEQALARHGLVDHRTDVYSLGATLYELLTLRPAVDGATREEILHRLAFEEPVAPRKLDRTIPAELETVTLKAMARDPQERYATARELADDLRRWLADRPILARPLGLFGRLRKWCQRHRPLVVALSAFLILLVAGLCLGAVAYGVRKGELAEERSRLAQQKEQSQRKTAEELRQVLVNRAEAVRLARLPGYRRHVWADLRRAISLPAGDRDLDQVRATVLESLGDPVGLDPVENPAAVPRRKQPGLPSEFARWLRKAANGGPTALSPDGDLVAVAGHAGRVAIYSRQSKLIREEKCLLGEVYNLAVAAGGKILVAGCEEGFLTWELPGPQCWAVRAGNVYSVDISPNRRLLAISGRQLELWSLATKRLLASWPTPAAGARLEFSADGRIVLVVSGGVPVAGWPISDTPERRVLDGHTAGVPALAFSPDGRLLVSVSRDRTVRVCDGASGRLLRILTGHPGEVEAVAFSPDGSLLATGDRSGRLRVWAARSGDLLTETNHGEPPDQIWRLQFGPGGEYLAAAGGHVNAWTVQEAPGRVILERFWTLGRAPGGPGTIDLAVPPGGPELVCLNRGGQLYCHDLSTGDDPQLVGTAGIFLRSLHFTPAGDRFTFITPGGTLGLGDRRGKKVGDTHRRAESVAVSADGRWAAVGQTGRKVTVIELVSGREVLALPAEGSDIWCMAWAPDGTKLAVGLSDGAIAVWDLEQVRARLAEFGLYSPGTGRAGGIPTPAPVPAFDRVVRVNRLRSDAERARRLATEARQAGNHAAQRDHLLTAMNLDERLAEIVPEAAGHLRRLAGTHNTLAGALAQLGDTRGALRHADVGAGMLNRLLAGNPGNPQYRRLLAGGLTCRSRVLDRAGRLAEAVDDARRAVADREKLAADPGGTIDREQLVVAYHNLGFQLARAGRPAEAQLWYQAALTAGDRLAADVPTAADAAQFRFGRGTTLHNLGVLRARAGATSAAGKLLREAAAVRAELADDFPENPGYASETGLTLDWHGAVLRDLGQMDESARVFREAIRRQRAALCLRPGDSLFLKLCCLHQGQLADLLLRMARHADAAAAAREMSRLAPDDATQLLWTARLLARCVAPAERDPDLDSAARLARARAYRGEAVALVRRAVSRGSSDAAGFLSDPDFDSVRDCDEFRLLLDKVTLRKKP
jgi:serine/threonine protein kinase/WD40 repeat protein/tetratricopeptide (TPR) repeat protein